MTKRRAREVLRADTYRRVWTRTLRLIRDGTLAAVGVWTIALWIFTVQAEFAADAARTEVPRAGDLFSVTVDPVLPALVAALLALAVIKAGGYAPTVIIWTVALVGTMAVMWAVMSISAILGAADDATAAARAVAAIALTIICVAVSVTIAEVLPLSEEPRRRQLSDRAVTTRDLAVRLLNRTQGRRLQARYVRPYSPRAARRLLSLWYVIPALVPLLAVLPYALASESAERAAGLAIGAVLGVFLSGLVGAMHWTIVGYMEEPDKSRRSSLVGGIAVASLLAFAVLGTCVSLMFLRWPIPLLAVPPAVVGVLVVVGSVLPLTIPMPRMGLLSQVAVARRSFVLQQRGARYDEAVLANARLRKRPQGQSLESSKK